MTKRNRFSRREFLMLSALGIGTAALRTDRLFQFGNDEIVNSIYAQNAKNALNQFPIGNRLARVVVGKVDLKAKADIDSENVGALYENAVVPWIKEVVGKNPYRFVQRFVETPEGYIWSPHVQKANNQIVQSPLNQLPSFGDGLGMWVEVSVPFVDLVIENPPVRSPAFQAGVPQRLYYKQVIWADDIRLDNNGDVWYRLNEKFGSYGDIFWAPGKAFNVITPEDVSAISPDVEDKRIVVNINQDVQTLSCFEGNTEVFFCQIAGGKKADAEGKPLDKSSTPLGTFPTYWKLFSIHMSGGSSGVGWDLIGVAWTTFFATPGIAIHSTFWHNNFGGEYMSHGCVNARPEDAKWIFRWSQPYVPYVDGQVTVQMPGGTKVQVIET